MRHKDSEHEGKAVGHGEFANMPSSVKFSAYPKAQEFGPGDLDDTQTEINRTMATAKSKSHKHLSNQH